MKLETLDDVLQTQLADLMSAEKQLVEALPKVADAAASDDLRDAIQHHLDETRGHVDRLEQVFGSLGLSPSSHHCKAMAGLIAESEEIVNAGGSDHAKDAALIAAAQRVEHYEIAGYGTARSLAQQLDRSDAASLLSETLDEESAADSKLTDIAMGAVNQQAAR